MLFKSFLLKSTALTLSAVLLGSTASQAGRIAPHLEENEQTTEKTYSQTKKVVNIEPDTEITKNLSDASFPSLKSDDLLLTHDNLGLARMYSGVRSQKTEKSLLVGYKFPDISMPYLPYLGLGFERYVTLSNRVDDESSSSDDEENRTHENLGREGLMENDHLAGDHCVLPTYAYAEYTYQAYQKKKPTSSFGIELRLQF